RQSIEKPYLPMAFSSDLQRLVVTGFRDSWLWNLNPNAQIHAEQLHIEDLVVSVALSPDMKHLAVGNSTNEVRLWSLPIKKDSVPDQVLKGHKTRVYALAYSSDGKFLATGSRDGAAVWDLGSRNPLQSRKILISDAGEVTAVAFSQDGTHLVT